MLSWLMWPFGKRKRTEPLLEGAAPRIPIVSFDPSRVTTAVKSDIRLTLQGVSELRREDFALAYEAAIRSVSAGRDLAILSEALCLLGLSNRRASEVARFVNNRATAVITREQQLSLGIDEAVWLYSGQACAVNFMAPSPEEEARNADHLAANGKRYPIATGMLMSGRRVWPGQDPGCKCVSGSVVAGFS